MNEVLEVLKQRIVYEAEHRGDAKALAELVNSYTNLVKVAAGTTTDNSLLAKEATRILLETGMNLEGANNFIQGRSKDELMFIVACDEVSKEFNRDRQD